MLSAISSADTAIYFRPVEAPERVATRAEEQRGAGVVDSDGRSLSAAPSDPLALSQEKRALLAQLRGERSSLETELLRADAPDVASVGGDYSDEELQSLSELKARDQEVRAHENAHALTGGAFAGAPRYDYQIGPDGQRYAIGGSVAIDVSPASDDPAATADQMRQVERAALAAADPSPTDRAVAQAARAEAQSAEAEIASQSAEERSRAEPQLAVASQMATAGYAQTRAVSAERATPIFRLAA